jgi:cytochrome c oxidase assembly protein subunit 15
MNGELLPSNLFNLSEWSLEKFNNYDSYDLLPALIQFLHRLSAYILFIFGCIASLRLMKKENFVIIKKYIVYFFAMLLLQVILGIITVTLCKGEVPILWGVLHQAGALLLLTASLVLRYKVKSNISE